MAVREGLLALLSEAPRQGYHLKTAFEAATGGAWPLNVGQVYTTLDRLQRDGLVTCGEADGQKQYVITPAGREALGGWWTAVPGDAPPPRDELLLKVLLAVEDDLDHALEVITHHRTALTRSLQQHRRATRREAPDHLAAVLVSEALVTRAEADLRWLDLCEAQILRRGTTHITPTTDGDLHG